MTSSTGWLASSPMTVLRQSQMIRKSGVPAWIDLERPDGRWVGPDGAAPPYLPFGLERFSDPAEPYAHVAADGQVTSVHPVFPVSVVCEWAADMRRPPASPRATGRRRPPVGERGRDLFDDHE